MDMKLYTMKRKWWNCFMTSYDCFYSTCDIYGYLYTTQPRQCCVFCNWLM